MKLDFPPDTSPYVYIGLAVAMLVTFVYMGLEKWVDRTITAIKALPKPVRSSAVVTELHQFRSDFLHHKLGNFDILKEMVVPLPILEDYDPTALSPSASSLLAMGANDWATAGMLYVFGTSGSVRTYGARYYVNKAFVFFKSNHSLNTYYESDPEFFGRQKTLQPLNADLAKQLDRATKKTTLFVNHNGQTLVLFTKGKLSDVLNVLEQMR